MRRVKLVWPPQGVIPNKWRNGCGVDYVFPEEVSNCCTLNLYITSKCVPIMWSLGDSRLATHLPRVRLIGNGMIMD